MATPELKKLGGKLALCWTDEAGKEQSYSVDYGSPSFQYRLKTSVRAQDLLVRAVGASKLKPTVWDFTLGLGADAVQLAAWGCEVTAWERNPKIYALVEDALRRAREHKKTAEWCERIEIHLGEAHSIVTTEKPTVVYLDPMYPSIGRAKPKKELVLLRKLAGDDLDAMELFHAAWNIAAKRVVVKRPDKAPAIIEAPEPHHFIKGKTVRFDVYEK